MAIPESLLNRFFDLKSYVGWSETDDNCSEQLSRILLPHSEELLQDFYREIQKHPASSRVITGGEIQIERLKRSLSLWLADMLQSKHDENYVLRRWKIGHKHVEIGLEQLYVNAAFARVRSYLSRILCQNESIPEDVKFQLHESLHKRLDLDLAIMVDAYQEEYQSSQVPVDRARLNQQKLLALLSKEALAGASLNEIYDQAIAYLSQAFRADLCELSVFDSDADHLRMESMSGWVTKSNGSVIELGNAHPGISELLTHKGCVETSDWQLQPRIQPISILVDERVVSSLHVVVRGEEDVYGLLGVHFRQPHRFHSSDHDFLFSIANLLANAIHRSRIEFMRDQIAQQLRRLVDRLPAGAVYVVNHAMQINSAVEQMTGYSREELTNLTEWNRHVLNDSVVEDRQAPPLSSGKEGQTHHRQLKLRRADGQERLISQVKFQSGADEVWLLHDITEEAERHKNQLQSERLAAIGQMITGLAHESRNALQRIQACTEMLELELEDNKSAMSLIVRSQQAIDDLQMLYDEVRNYASPLSLSKEWWSLKTLLQQAWGQVEHDWKDRDANLLINLDPEDLEIEVDRFRMVQVFRNFFENSLAACTDPVLIQVDSRLANETDRSGVEITVSDNGPGLSPTGEGRIFEPFYTTKPKGSGLGMAIASRIVTAHHGVLETTASLLVGASFRLSIPHSNDRTQ